MEHDSFNISGQVLISNDGSLSKASAEAIQNRMLGITGYQVKGGVHTSSVPGNPDYDGSVMYRATQPSLFENQITYNGVQSILAALATQSAPLTSITNMFLLSDFALPEGKTEKTLTWKDVRDFIAPQCILGNNGRINADQTRDLRSYISQEPPFELTLIGTIPASKGNQSPEYNAAILVLQGDVEQSVSRGSDSYTEVGTEVLFSICRFDSVIKDSQEAFSIVWYVTVQS